MKLEFELVPFGSSSRYKCRCRCGTELQNIVACRYLRGSANFSRDASQPPAPPLQVTSLVHCAGTQEYCLSDLYTAVQTA